MMFRDPRTYRPKLMLHLSRGVACTALIALAIASCVGEGEDPTSAVSQASGSGGSGDGGGSGDPTAQFCPPKPSPEPATASCLTADKMLFNETLLATSGTATGDYPIGIGQENEPPPDAYRADVCERAWNDCVNGGLIPLIGSFCSSTCNGACASPGAPTPFGNTPGTTWTIVPCGSIQCWRITCQAYGCASQVGCCATITGPGSGG
jgi:hypothetical protein